MKSWIAFFKKEVLESIRSKKIMIFLVLSLLFGIMNPAIAKLTPWVMEQMAETLADSGIVVTEVPIDALTSWAQFFKNIPLALIVFVLIYSGIFSKEYESGTLVLMITKGLARSKVVLAKFVLLLLTWSLGFWFCFGITYGYNAYYWDNSIAKELVPATMLWWLFGLWVVCLMTFTSTIAKSQTGVLVGTGGLVFVFYLVSLVPKLSNSVPTALMNGASILTQQESVGDYQVALLITIALCVAFVILSVPIMNKKKL